MLYKHNKTGNLYKLLFLANEVDTDKFPKTAIYISLVDGKIYSRSYKEFNVSFTKNN